MAKNTKPTEDEIRDVISRKKNGELILKVVDDVLTPTACIGDVFLMRSKKTGKTIVNEISGLPSKWVIVEVYKGLPIARKINSSGKLSNSLTCLTGSIDTDRYEYYPDQIIAYDILLGVKSDPTESHKFIAKARTLAKKHNKPFRFVDKFFKLTPTDLSIYSYDNAVRIFNDLLEFNTKELVLWELEMEKIKTKIVVKSVDDSGNAANLLKVEVHKNNSIKNESLSLFSVIGNGGWRFYTQEPMTLSEAIELIKNKNE